MSMSRRKFVRRASVGLLSGATLSIGRSAEPAANSKGGDLPLIVSTWPFGKPSNEAALKVLLQGASILDAVEQGIWVTESDAANRSVGLGGLPNAAGVVQLDSCIMSGPGHRAGGVAALEGIRHPISAARRVMEKTPHVLLVGEGARMFALEEGLEAVEVDTRERYDAWRKQRAAQKSKAQGQPKGNHDTIALLVLGADGNIAGGCSTSGLAGKLPGRVGDSPIIGSGLYVDNEVGAAGATGVGENVMRYCGSFLVVEYMRQGLHPQDACLETIRRIARQDPKGVDLSINFVALDKKGRYGAAGTGKGFQYSVTTRAASVVLTSPGVSDLDVGPVGGNRR
jgi:N4-(beta-N-acetylglucosaminyl)-L-asparaginase